MAFEYKLRGERCPKCGGQLFEIDMPHVACGKCQKRYVLAIHRGAFFVHAQLLEDISQPATVVNVPSQTQIKETTVVKEVVMIPCDHCSQLTPQTSLFCPNCGASRKK